MAPGRARVDLVDGVRFTVLMALRMGGYAIMPIVQYQEL
jgi:hypothetical protein